MAKKSRLVTGLRSLLAASCLVAGCGQQDNPAEQSPVPPMPAPVGSLAPSEDASQAIKTGQSAVPPVPVPVESLVPKEDASRATPKLSPEQVEADRQAQALNQQMAEAVRGQRPHEALRRAQQALRILREVFPKDHPYVADGLKNVAAALVLLRRHDEAERLAREALDIVRKSAPADAELIATHESLLKFIKLSREEFAASNLPNVPEKEQLARLDEKTESLIRMQLEEARRRLPADHPVVAGWSLALATHLKNRGKPAQAEPLAREAVAAFERSWPKSANNPVVLGSVAQVVADVLQGAGMEREGKRFAHDDRAIADAICQIAKMSSGIVLSEALRAQGQPRKAEQVLRGGVDSEEERHSGGALDEVICSPRARAVIERVGLDALVFEELATTLIEQNKPVEAELFQHEAVRRLADRFPDNHPGLARRRDALASILEQRDALGEASELLGRAVRVYKLSYPDDHPVLIRARERLQRLRTQERGSATATALAGGKVMDIPRALEIDAEVEKLYRNRAYIDAIRQARLSLETRRKALPPGNLAIARSLQRLALALESADYDNDQAVFEAISDGRIPVKPGRSLAERDLAEVEALFREALSIRWRALRPGDPDRSETMAHLARCLMPWKPYDAMLLYSQIKLERLKVRPLDDEQARRNALYGELYRKANDLFGLGRFDQAEELARRSLDVLRRGLPVDRPELVPHLDLMTRCLMAEGRFAEAEPLLREALRIDCQSLPSFHISIGDRLHQLGFCLRQRGRVHEAEQALRDALVARSKALVYYPPISETLLELMKVFVEQGRVREAQSILGSCFANRRSFFGGESLPMAEIYDYQADLRMGESYFAEAEKIYREALAIRQAALPPDHPLIGASLSKLARVSLRRGKWRDGEQIIRKALAVQVKSVPIMPEGSFFVMTSGNADDQAPLLQPGAVPQCEIQNFEPGPGAVSESFRLLAQLLIAQHDEKWGNQRDRDAGKRKDRARESARVDSIIPPPPDAPLGELKDGAPNLGRVTDETQLLGEAQAALKEAVHYARLGVDRDAHLAHSDLGWFHAERGNFGEAIRPLEEAMTEVERRFEVGGVRYGDLVAHFDRIKAESLVYDRLVHVDIAQGRIDKAIEHLERGRAKQLRNLLSRSRGPVASSILRGGTEGHFQGIEKLNGEYSRLMVRITELERSVRSQNAEAAVGGRERVEAELLGQLKASRNELDAVRLKLDKFIRDSVMGGDYADAGRLQAFLSGSQRLVVYHINAATDSTWLFVIPPKGSSIRSYRLKLPSGESVGSSFLTSVIRNHLAEECGLGEPVLDRTGLTRNLVPGLKARDDPHEARHAPLKEAGAGGGPTLFELLVPDEIRNEIMAAEVIYVIPDGLLHRLPFETLVLRRGSDAATRRYWLDDGPPVVYCPSGTVLLDRVERHREQRKNLGGRPRHEVVALGDPIFQRSKPYGPQGTGGVNGPTTGVAVAEMVRATAGQRRGGYSPLPGTRIEVGRIYKALAGKPLGSETTRDPTQIRRADFESAQDRSASVLPLLGEQATASNLFRAAPDARCLHLATHGASDETRRASYTSLITTLPEHASADDAGQITLEDLLTRWSHRLDACELVVLSACETHSGEVVGGEMSYSLPYGFMSAGSPSVIASLWSVSDLSTAELMGDFYARRKPMDSVSADRPNKLIDFVAARKQLRVRYPEPFRWGAFVLLGSPY